MTIAFPDSSTFKQAIQDWFSGNAVAKQLVIATYGDMNVWDTSQVTDMREAFKDRTESMTNSDEQIGGWDTHLVTNMSGMFQGALTFNQDISSWDTHLVQVMNSMFNGASLFDKPLATDVNKWNTSAVEDMRFMFRGASAFNQNISSWDTSAVTNMNQMFEKASKFNQPLATAGNKWNTGNVKDMSYMFQGASVFDKDISNWDTHLVEDMNGMFDGASKFNQPLATAGNKWNTGNVKDMSGMFYEASVFNQDISSWDTHLVEDMREMFFGASLFDKPLATAGNKWNTGNVKDMSYMFAGASVFNQDISSWDTHLVENMLSMFAGASAFNQPLATAVNKWNTSAVTNMSGMFARASLFDKDISSWDTHLVEDMLSMFAGASAFNQPLATAVNKWNTSAVTNMGDMFRGASVFNQDISSWAVSQKPLIVEMFITSGIVTGPNYINNNLIYNEWLKYFTVSELNDAGLYLQSMPIISNICFPAGTPIQTDQGVLPIEHIDVRKNTIGQKAIRHITQTVTLDQYLICFEKNSVARNVPTKRTLMTKDHQLLFNGQLVPAERFLNFSREVKKVKYSGEILYNVLMDTHNTMTVNGLQCETLHPENLIAKLYRKHLSAEERHRTICIMNESLQQRDLLTYKKSINEILYT
jgi:surface protein